MPGYNHYSDCMCGWCYKERQNFFSAEPVRNLYDLRSGQRQLSAAGVLRSWTACFVAPNAKCPVCDAKVYYYQNKQGGRVFFDALGWPWPKHGCTDNPRARKGNIDSTPIKILPRGTSFELLTTAKQIQFDPTEIFRKKFGHPWDLLIVDTVDRDGDRFAVEAKSLLPLMDETRLFSLRSQLGFPDKGELFSFDGEKIAFLDPDSFEVVKLSAREHAHKGETLILSENFDKALVYASELHRNQVRKGSDVPYISHLLGVTSRVIVAGGTEVQAIAALLHDAAEDQGGAETLREIESRFGPAVAKIVEDCTDSWVDPKPEWRPRKEAYVASLSHKAPASLLVSLADKVDNAHAILNDYEAIGESLWDRFTGRREGTLWYYRALYLAFDQVLPCALCDELGRVVREFPED